MESKITKQDEEKIILNIEMNEEEWNKALLDTNQAILEIIKTEPALAQFIQYDANGQAYLGGADYERYIAEKNRMSQLLQAEKTSTSKQVLP